MSDTIDSTPSVPPPRGEDRDYITQDIMSALERAVVARIDACAEAAGIGRRRAAVRILRALGEPSEFDVRDFYDLKASWSFATFGQGPRVAGVVAHIRKELNEIEADPTDLEEWIDVVLLAMDGARRCAGADGRAFVAALDAKHRKNLGRRWPSPTSQDEPVEHVREPADDALDARLASIVESVRR